MALPVIAYYAVFHYGPMYGAIIDFQNYSPMKGIRGSEWVGLELPHLRERLLFLAAIAQHGASELLIALV